MIYEKDTTRPIYEKDTLRKYGVHPAEVMLDAIEAWWLALRIPADMYVLGLRDPSASADPQHGSGQLPSLASTDGGVTRGETTTGRYPPGMRDSF